MELLDGEEILHKETDTGLYLKELNGGVGDLFVTTQRLLWKQQQQQSTGDDVVSVPYTSVILHAISNEGPTGSACIYCQLSGDIASSLLPIVVDDKTRNGCCEDDGFVADDDEEVLEMKLVPSTDINLQLLFAKISEGSAMNPDDGDDDSDDREGLLDGGGDFNQSGWIPEEEGLLDDAEEEIREENQTA
eukprot:GHVS01010000.1.p1 GENE.GHVS01010000.1~~GHVS01010000.1.p1  ORF type:complete len:190 (-),score=54.78 GHVS01010000.1:80-649(-)